MTAPATTCRTRPDEAWTCPSSWTPTRTEVRSECPLNWVSPLRVGRPSTAEPYRQVVTDILGEDAALLSVEILRRARLAGCDGGKTALHELIAAVRPRDVPVEMRFEGLPGEFSQHDFGQI